MGQGPTRHDGESKKPPIVLSPVRRVANKRLIKQHTGNSRDTPAPTSAWRGGSARSNNQAGRTAGSPSALASHVGFSSSLARPCQIRFHELQGDIGSPETSLSGAYGRNPPSICSLSRDEPEITFAVGRLRRAGVDDEWRLTTGPAPAEIVRPAPDKVGVGAYAWRVGHITLLTIGKPKVAKRIR
jgi:hypothetical protein